MARDPHRDPGLALPDIAEPSTVAQLGGEPGGDTGLGLFQDRKTKKPKKFKVLMHNDDYTTQDFVIDVLVRHFHKAPGEATQIMLQVHTKGVAVAGIYPRDLAESKVHDVTLEARAQGMPLALSTEEA